MAKNVQLKDIETKEEWFPKTTIEQVEGLDEHLNSLQEKGDYPVYTPFQETRKTIQLRNHDTISGITTTGTGVDLVMLSELDVADFGSTQIKINLNGSEVRPVYNDDKQIALLDDVKNLKSEILGDDLTETFDTLKAVQEWANEHGTEYGQLVETVGKKVDVSVYEAKIKSLENVIKDLTDRLVVLETKEYSNVTSSVIE